MNAPRCNPADYIAYQIASPARYTCTEAARCQPEGGRAPGRLHLNSLTENHTGQVCCRASDRLHSPFEDSQGGETED